MNLFLAMTPTQLMNCIVLQYTIFKEEKSDLYFTENLRKYIYSLEKYNLFQNEYEYELIKDITDRKNIIKRNIVRIKNAIDIKKIGEVSPSNLLQYSRVLASGISLRNYEIYYFIKRINKNTEIVLYEEGICEYYNLAKRDSVKEIFSKIFFKSYYLKDCRKLYVYEPTVVKKFWKNIEVNNIPKFIYVPELIDILNEVYGYKNNNIEKFDGKYVFFDSSFYQANQEKKQTELLDTIANIVGKDRLLIKLHPRSSKDKYKKEYRFIESDIPFEIIAANSDITNTVFISVTSSIIINFKLMLDKEPRIVYLNDMESNRKKTESEKVFDRVKKLYSQETFYTPKNKEELRECLKSISH